MLFTRNLPGIWHKPVKIKCIENYYANMYQKKAGVAIKYQIMSTSEQRPLLGIKSNTTMLALIKSIREGDVSRGRGGSRSGRFSSLWTQDLTAHSSRGCTAGSHSWASGTFCFMFINYLTQFPSNLSLLLRESNPKSDRSQGPYCKCHLQLRITLPFLGVNSQLYNIIIYIWLYTDVVKDLGQKILPTLPDRFLPGETMWGAEGGGCGLKNQTILPKRKGSGLHFLLLRPWQDLV